MNLAADILEIPITSTKDVKELVTWLDRNKLHLKQNPALLLKNDETKSSILLVGVLLILGLALVVLEEKGKLKAKETKISTDDFRRQITSSPTEKGIEKLIESRYNVDLVIKKNRPSIKPESSKKYTLNDAFGIWKNKSVSLQNIREEQWRRKK